MRTISICGITLMLLACGCASTPTQEELANAYYGPYPDNYEEVLQVFVDNNIGTDPDPNTTTAKFERPVKGWFPLHSYTKQAGNPWALYEYGWIVKAWINTKNQHGGYTGDRPAEFLLRDGQIKMIGSLDISGYYARP